MLTKLAINYSLQFKLVTMKFISISINYDNYENDAISEMK